MTDKEAMAMALDALETEVSIDWTNNDEFNASAEKMHEAIAALKEQLAQPEQEPVATLEDLEQEIYQNTRNFVSRDVMEWMLKRYYTHPPQRTEQEPVAWRNAAIRVGEDLSSVGPDGYYDMTAQQWLDWAMEQQPHGKNSLAQPAQPPQRTEQNFCSRCGKRTKDIHTCTPPKETT